MNLSRLRQPYEWKTTVVHIEAGPHKITQALPDGITASDIYAEETTRRVPSTAKYLYLEREYSLSQKTAGAGAEVVEQTRFSGTAHILLLLMFNIVQILRAWGGFSTVPSLLPISLIMLVSGCSLGFILLGNNISTEDQEVTGDSVEFGVAITHFFIVVIISSCWGLAAIISRSELISSIRIIGSIIFISTVMSFFLQQGKHSSKRYQIKLIASIDQASGSVFLMLVWSSWGGQFQLVCYNYCRVLPTTSPRGLCFRSTTR